MELKLLFALAFLLLTFVSGVSSGSSHYYYLTSIFTLGDSHIDTGNFPIMARAINFPAWVNNRPPRHDLLWPSYRAPMRRESHRRFHG